MSLKTLAAVTPRFCTILDVATKFPKIVTESINLDQSDSPISRYSYEIDASIIDVTQEIYAALKPTYSSYANLLASTPWVGLIISDKQNSSPSSRLRACEAGASAITEMFSVDFSSATAYTVTGWLSGGLGSGTISTDFTASGDGDILIKAATNSGLFTGTFTTGDTIFISVNKWNRTVSTIATYLSTADVLKNIAFSTGINIDPSIFERYANHAKRILDRLQRPDDKDGYIMDGLPSQDLSDIQLGDWGEDLYDSFGQADLDFFGNDDIGSYTI